MSEKDFMKLDMVKNLTLLLMDSDPSLSIDAALSVVINSATFGQLQKDATRLYYQSPRYVFAFLQDELGNVSGSR